MKIRIALFLVLNILITALKGQDSLSVEVLKPLTYTFTIENGQLKGAGADFIKKEIANAQFTLLGDYLGSNQIPYFTDALIPELDKLDYKMMVMGTGPTDMEILCSLYVKSNNLSQGIKTLNQQYLFEEKGRTYTPILDFKNVEDAVYLEKALDLNWKVLGIGQESWNGLLMLADQLFQNLPTTAQKKHKNLYLATVETLKNAYSDRNGDYLKFSNRLKTAKTIDQFLNIVTLESTNHGTIDAFKHSIELCGHYAIKAFYEENELRIKKEKQLLKAGLDAAHFDASKDKLLVKMDHHYAAKGFQFYGFYGIGNTLHEMATYHGNTALHIGFIRRFYKDQDKLKDELTEDKIQIKRLKKLVQLGLTDEWVLIDLRPLIKGSYYWPAKYLLNEWETDLIKKFDVLIIPKTEEAAQGNYCRGVKF